MKEGLRWRTVSVCALNCSSQNRQYAQAWGLSLILHGVAVNWGCIPLTSRIYRRADAYGTDMSSGIEQNLSKLARSTSHCKHSSVSFKSSGGHLVPKNKLLSGQAHAIILIQLCSGKSVPVLTKACRISTVVDKTGNAFHNWILGSTFPHKPEGLPQSDEGKVRC